MESNRQPESEDSKLRRRLEECRLRARQLEVATRAPANLPRIDDEPAPLTVPLRKPFLPGVDLNNSFPQSEKRAHDHLQAGRVGRTGQHDEQLSAQVLPGPAAVPA
jgi:hypothetical protein